METKAGLPEFDATVINQALEAAQRHGSALRADSISHETPLADGQLKVSAQCISVTVTNGQVCLNLPLGIGSVCLPVRGSPTARRRRHASTSAPNGASHAGSR